MNQEYLNFQKSTEKKQFDLKYMCIGLSGEVGEVCNEIKKMERDDNNQLTEKRKLKIIEELGDTMWYLTGILNRINVSIDDILLENMSKLQPNLNLKYKD